MFRGVLFRSQVLKSAGEYGLSLKEYRVRGERAYYIFKKSD